jgi:enoyl-CoA hydratase
MAYECILTEVEDSVGIVTLHRPEVLNAMNRQLVREMNQTMHAFEADGSVGCIVFTGAGENAFLAGGDIHEQRSDDKLYTLEQQPAMGSGHSAFDVGACTKPTIGMMNGLAYGGQGYCRRRRTCGWAARAPSSAFWRRRMAA